MDERWSSEKLKEFLLSQRIEPENDLPAVSSNCYGLSWKKDHWVVKVNGKKTITIEAKQLPVGFNLRNPVFLADVLAILRQTGVEGLEKYLKSLKSKKTGRRGRPPGSKKRKTREAA